MCQLLLAESDPVLTQSLTRLLRDRYSVATTDRAEEVVGKVASLAPAVLILDAGLALAVEINLLRSIKQIVQPDLRVILTYAPGARGLDALLPYCDVLFRKPFAHSELLSTVDGLLRVAA